MPKVKTSSGAKKKFKVSGTGKLIRRHAKHRLPSRDHPFGHHLGGDPYRRRRRALAGACLQQVEAAPFDRELDVLHVREMPLEQILRRQQFLVGAG